MISVEDVERCLERWCRASEQREKALPIFDPLSSIAYHWCESRDLADKASSDRSEEKRYRITRAYDSGGGEESSIALEDTVELALADGTVRMLSATSAGLPLDYSVARLATIEAIELELDAIFNQCE